MTPSNNLSNKTFGFTGKLDDIPRFSAERWVEYLGGRVVSSITTKLDYLVAGTTPGPKLGKALSLNITILDRDAFLQIVGRGTRDLEASTAETDQADWHPPAQKAKDESHQPLHLHEIPGIAGKHFTFSGLLRGVTRETAEDLVCQAGGIVEYTVTKSRTDYVVTDYSGGSELDKARKWGKPIIGGKELLAMLKGDA